MPRYGIVMVEFFLPGSNDKADSGSDGTKKDRPMPDLCVICLEQEYNAVFIP